MDRSSLACLLSLERIFALDFEDGTLDLLATSPCHWRVL